MYQPNARFFYFFCFSMGATPSHGTACRNLNAHKQADRGRKTACRFGGSGLPKQIGGSKPGGGQFGRGGLAAAAAEGN